MSQDETLPVAAQRAIRKTPLVVAEGILRLHHLRRKDRGECRALCGVGVFPTKIPLKTWGLVTDLRERYCEECENIANAIRSHVTGAKP
mgnify:CR=1 FL=1